MLVITYIYLIRYLITKTTFNIWIEMLFLVVAKWSLFYYELKMFTALFHLHFFPLKLTKKK